MSLVTNKQTKAVIPHFRLQLNKAFDDKFAELAQYEKEDDELLLAGDKRNRFERFLLSVLDSLPKIQHEANDALHWIEQNSDANSDEFEKRMKQLEVKFISFMKESK